jgi:hypothetical protein
MINRIKLIVSPFLNYIRHREALWTFLSNIAAKGKSFCCAVLGSKSVSLAEGWKSIAFSQVRLSAAFFPTAIHLRKL